MADCPRCRELVQGLAAANKLYGELSNELAEGYRRIHQLEAALKKYGRHLTECLWVQDELRQGLTDSVIVPRECSCHLTTALRGTPDG